MMRLSKKFILILFLIINPLILNGKVLKSTDFINNKEPLSTIKNEVPAKYEFQKEAMNYVSLIINAIKKTDYEKAIFGLRQLKTIDFSNVASPLSLLYELINGIGDGREDFLVLGFKHVLFSEIRRIAQNVFQNVVNKKRYVALNTKNNTLERLKSFKKNLDPKREACAGVIKNIDYIIAVVEKLPENNSKIWELLVFTSNIISVITKKDSDALKNILKTIHQKSKQIYFGNLLNQITIIEATAQLILNSNHPELFEELLYFYKNTNIPEVKYEIIKAFGKISRMYYGGDINNKNFADPAYKSFEMLLKIANSSKTLSISSLWWLRCAAAEELILLEHKLKDQNAKRTVERYLKDLQKKEEKKSKKILFKIGKKIGKDSSNEYVLCVLKNRNQIYNIKLIKDSLKNINNQYNKTYLSMEEMLVKSLENQNIIIEKLDKRALKKDN
ncbi:MAG: hypothetical protein GY830_01890 [Bacteroidetes bacterium]|nr:hypothetical protein [Bacteroidota bacterium]